MIPVSTHPISEQKTRKVQPSAYIPDTAFILMWMDRSQPQLAKVRDAIKEVCASFNITALRADDVEHSDEVTEVVLQRIADSEFIVADLTGERPNVYYEVGYAHAMKKRMILYRKKGTNLHFNLASYSIPEYTNLTDLKTRLKKRFEAILGREAMDSTSQTSIKPASQ